MLSVRNHLRRGTGSLRLVDSVAVEVQDWASRGAVRSAGRTSEALLRIEVPTLPTPTNTSSTSTNTNNHSNPTPPARITPPSSLLPTPTRSTLNSDSSHHRSSSSHHRSRCKPRHPCSFRRRRCRQRCFRSGWRWGERGCREEDLEEEEEGRTSRGTRDKGGEDTLGD